MSWEIFGQVWLFTIIGFVIGLVLTWVIAVLPLRKKLAQRSEESEPAQHRRDGQEETRHTQQPIRPAQPEGIASLAAPTAVSAAPEMASEAGSEPQATQDIEATDPAASPEPKERPAEQTVILEALDFDDESHAYREYEEPEVPLHGFFSEPRFPAPEPASVDYAARVREVESSAERNGQHQEDAAQGEAGPDSVGQDSAGQDSAGPDGAATAGSEEHGHGAESSGPFGAGSALPLADGSAPDSDFTVKARTSSMVFHTENSPFYDGLLPQVWFRSAQDAEHAGFTSWERPHED